jgi:hypothetical protein
MQMTLYGYSMTTLVITTIGTLPNTTSLINLILYANISVSWGVAQVASFSSNWVFFVYSLQTWIFETIDSELSYQTKLGSLSLLF